MILQEKQRRPEETAEGRHWGDGSRRGSSIGEVDSNSITGEGVAGGLVALGKWGSRSSSSTGEKLAGGVVG